LVLLTPLFFYPMSWWNTTLLLSNLWIRLSTLCVPCWRISKTNWLVVSRLMTVRFVLVVAIPFWYKLMSDDVLFL
jgi:hypothetical protein